MSDPEGFAARWSRLKRASAKEHQDAKPADAQSQPADSPPAETLPPSANLGPSRPDPSTIPFDAKALPPIESITAESDITAFLQSGVPAELTKAALRRVWTADPAIRDFIGLAENQWDFTDPASIPGFGPLEAKAGTRELVSQAMGQLGNASGLSPTDGVPSNLPTDAASHEVGATPASGAPQQVASTLPEDASLAPSDGQDDLQQKAEVAGRENVAPSDSAPEIQSRRTHGGALPK